MWQATSAAVSVRNLDFPKLIGDKTVFRRLTGLPLR